MVVFVTGGSGCGKSAFAEKAAQHFGGKLIYVATMPVFSAEDEKKVLRHHKLRAGKGFETLERPKKLTDIPDSGETVLIECMSTHTANMIFDPEISCREDPSGEKSLSAIRNEIRLLCKRSGTTIFVSAETAADGTVYDEETEKYKRVLTGVNRCLMEEADAAFEVVCGIPVLLKGDLHV